MTSIVSVSLRSPSHFPHRGKQESIDISLFFENEGYLTLNLKKIVVFYSPFFIFHFFAFAVSLLFYPSYFIRF